MDSMDIIGHLDCNTAIICGIYVCNIWAMDIHAMELMSKLIAIYYVDCLDDFQESGRW